MSKHYDSAMQNLQREYKMDFDLLEQTKPHMATIEAALKALPIEDEPSLRWDRISGRWAINVFPLALPEVTDALRILVNGGFHFQQHFPKEVTDSYAMATLKHKDGPRIHFTIVFSRSATCRLEDVAEEQHVQTIKKRRLVCDGPTPKQISLPDTQLLESGSESH